MLDLSARYNQINVNLFAEFQNALRELTVLSGITDEKISLILSCVGCGEYQIIQSIDSQLVVAKFAIKLLPNCAIIATLCDSVVNPRYRNRGIASKLHLIKLRALAKSGVKLAVATVLEANTYQRKIMEKNGYIAAATGLHNDRTSSAIILFQKDLTNYIVP